MSWLVNVWPDDGYGDCWGCSLFGQRISVSRYKWVEGGDYNRILRFGVEIGFWPNRMLYLYLGTVHIGFHRRTSCKPS